VVVEEVAQIHGGRPSLQQPAPGLGEAPGGEGEAGVQLDGGLVVLDGRVPRVAVEGPLPLDEFVEGGVAPAAEHAQHLVLGGSGDLAGEAVRHRGRDASEVVVGPAAYRRHRLDAAGLVHQVEIDLQRIA
jgi:hypothetical protein